MPALALVKHVENSIQEAVAGRSNLTLNALLLAGMSGPTTRHFLNNLCRPSWVDYLEVGTWKGATLIGASYGNPGRFTAVDDFSQFSDPRVDLKRNLRAFRAHCRVAFHEADCWRIGLRRLPRDVNVYLYDGAHGREHHFRAFTRFDPVFAQRFVAVVDDWRWDRVRDGTRDALQLLRYRVLFERELIARNMYKEHWGNGLYVAVLEKPRPIGRARGGGAKDQPGGGAGAPNAHGA